MTRMPAQGQQRHLRAYLIGVTGGLLLLVLFSAFLFVRAEKQRGFKLAFIKATDGFPYAEFQKEFARYRWLNVKSFGSDTRIHVQRHGTWTELPLSESQKLIILENLVRKAGGKIRTARVGYTIGVRVPVCNSWRIETEIYETHRIGIGGFGFDLTSTNRWQSDEMPGWSEIRKDFNAVK